MSLVGNLEDLGLGDILQIVSLSRKSGVLRLAQSARKGAIIFRDGQVVSAALSDKPASLGKSLVAKKIVTEDQKSDVEQVWANTGQRDSLITLFHQHCGISREQIQTIVREHVEQVVYSLFRWNDGNFNFELKPVEEELAQLGPEDAQFVLDVGLNPQYLAMEGARLFDEAVASGEAEPEPEPAPPPPGLKAARPAASAPVAPPQPPPPAAPVPAVSAPPAEAGGKSRLLIIDDDSLTRAQLEKKFSERGFYVISAPGTRDGLRQIASLHQEGKSFFLMADLLMPRSDDAGILGGLEILEHVKNEGVNCKILVVTDYDNEDAKKKALALGTDAFLRKPRKTQLSAEQDTPELTAFVDDVAPMLATWAAKEPKPAAPIPQPVAAPARKPAAPAPAAAPSGNGARPSDLVNIRDELAKEFEEGFFEDDASASLSRVEPSRGLAMLKTMTDELNDPNSNVEITLLVLRFAAELMSRAVIFVVTPNDIRGLGEFGVEIQGDIALKRVRGMKVPLNESSVLRQAIDRQIPLRVKLSSGKWDQYIVKQLGGITPAEVFVAPIMSANKVVAILYADNVPGQEPLGDTESLEIFLMQAGMAMDRALLSRQLKTVPRQ